MRARLATVIRYLSNDSHSLRMLAFIDDKSDDVATFRDPGPRPPELHTTRDPAIRNGSARSGCPASGQRSALWACPAHRPARHPRAQGRVGLAEGRCALVDGAGSGDYLTGSRRTTGLIFAWCLGALDGRHESMSSTSPQGNFGAAAGIPPITWLGTLI